MTDPIEIKGESGKWEIVSRKSKGAPKQVHEFEDGDYITLRRLPEPKPMPKLKPGMVVVYEFLDEIHRAMYVDGNGLTQCEDGSVVGPCEMQYLQIYYKGDLIWKRGEA